MDGGRGARLGCQGRRQKKALIRALMAFNGTIVGAPEQLLCHCPRGCFPAELRHAAAQHSGLLMRLLKHRDIYPRRRQRHSSPVREVFMKRTAASEGAYFLPLVKKKKKKSCLLPAYQIKHGYQRSPIARLAKQQPGCHYK